MPNTITGDAAVTSATGSNALGTGATPGVDPSQQGPITEVGLNVKKQWTLDQLQRLRNFRRPYDQRRSFYYRQYIGQRDRRLFPDNLTPRSNTFVPYPSSNVDTLVSRVHDAFFSLDPAIEVRAKGMGDPQAMQLVLLTALHRAKWVEQIELFVRDLGIYGHAGLKVDWDWDYDTVTGPEPIYQMVPVVDQNTQQPIIDATTGQPAMIPMMGPDANPIQIGTQAVTKKIPRNCPKLIPIDIYDLLIDPDKKIKCHVMEISWGELRRSAEANPKLYRPEAITELANKLNQYKETDRDGIIIRMAEVWNDTDKTVTQVTFGEDADAIGWKDRRYQYRNASYSAYKRRVYNGPPVLLYTGPNQFAHQRMPILDMAYIKVKGDTYGIGLIERISDLTEGVNVFTNMITDNWNLGINRRFAYDVQVDIDHEQLDMGNVPGGKIGVVGDPSKAIFPLPSFVPNQNDYMIVDLYRGMIEMASGISDFYAKGVGSPTGNRTSSGISQVINESGYIFKMLIRNVEQELLQPLAEMVASMIQQFGTPEMEWSITNAPPTIPMYGRVSLEKLIGSYDFDFVAANYATGKVVKQRNLMAFYNIAMQSPYVNQGEFLREIAKVMEIPYAQRLLKSDAQVQDEQNSKQQSAIQQQIIEKLLDFESKALVAGIANKEFKPGSVTPEAKTHALETQKIVEDYLAETAGLPVETPAEMNRNEGRPGTTGESAIPGGETQDMMRSFSQNNGANALGTGGTGE